MGSPNCRGQVYDNRLLVSNERGDVIPGDYQQYMLLTGVPTSAFTPDEYLGQPPSKGLDCSDGRVLVRYSRDQDLSILEHI